MKYTVELADAGCVEIAADSITLDAAGALILSTVNDKFSPIPVVAFAHRTWLSVYADGVQLLWHSQPEVNRVQVGGDPETAFRIPFA